MTPIRGGRFRGCPQITPIRGGRFRGCPQISQIRRASGIKKHSFRLRFKKKKIRRTLSSAKTLALAGLPATGFRAVGSDRNYSTASLENKIVECKYLDASWQLEIALAQEIDGDWGGENFAIALETKTHLQSAFYQLSKQIWYGTENDANGFAGLDTFIEAVTGADNDDGTMVIDANYGETVTDGSSVYAVRTGIDSIQLAWGSNGKFDEDDVVKSRIGTATAGRDFYTQRLGGWAGLQVTNKYAAAKISNLSATDPLVGLSDALLYKLINKFPAGFGPTAFFMTRRSLEQLRESRTATNATGEPAPIPTAVGGVPIFATDALTNTESTADGSGSGSGSGT